MVKVLTWGLHSAPVPPVACSVPRGHPIFYPNLLLSLPLYSLSPHWPSHFMVDGIPLPVVA